MKNKRLISLEYTDMGPRLGSGIFQAMSFEARYTAWGSLAPHFLLKEIFPDIERLQPDIIVFFLDAGYRRSPPTVKEPQEWLTACQRIRRHPNLQHTKLVAFLGRHKDAAKHREAWHKRYDFYTEGPVRVIEHARVLKRLVGEKVKGFEGVNYYLLNRGANWKIQPYLLGEQCKKSALQPDAKGQFPSRFSLKTRLLALGQEGKYTWGDSIQTDTPTCVVYSIKTLERWQRERLSTEEIERLSALAGKATPNCQLLIGANDFLLQANSEVIIQVLKLAQQAGGWQLFINEHLWFEGFCMPPQVFKPLVYRGVEIPLWKAPFAP